MSDIVQEARDHEWWWSDQNLAFRMIDEIERLRDSHEIAAWALADRQKELDRLREEATQLRQAVGMLTTLHPTMEIDVNNPVQMAQEIVSYVTESKDAEIERLRTAYDQEHQNCFNLTEKVIPNLKDDFKGIVYQLKVAAIANDWDTFDDVVAKVLGYES